MASKTAVVVGAGRLGTAVAAYLTTCGYCVIVAKHSDMELQDLASVQKFFLPIPKIDLLVNAAGEYGVVGKVRDVSPEDWKVPLNILLVGVYACCHYALPKMPPGSHIISFAGGGEGPLLMRSGLASAKRGVNRLTETLAGEEPQLYVNNIAPGPMHSKMQEKIVGLPHAWALPYLERKLGIRETVTPQASLRAIDYILRTKCTGKLILARSFMEATDAVAVG